MLASVELQVPHIISTNTGNERLLPATWWCKSCFCTRSILIILLWTGERIASFCWVRVNVWALILVFSDISGLHGGSLQPSRVQSSGSLTCISWSLFWHETWDALLHLASVKFLALLSDWHGWVIMQFLMLLTPDASVTMPPCISSTWSHNTPTLGKPHATRPTATLHLCDPVCTTMPHFFSKMKVFSYWSQSIVSRTGNWCFVLFCVVLCCVLFCFVWNAQIAMPG